MKSIPLTDVTEITEKQKMAVWLAIQVATGQMSKKKAIEEGHKFAQWYEEKE